MKRLSILLLMLIAIMTAKAQTSSWNTNVTWTPSFRTNAGATEVRFALGGTKPYFNLSDSLNMIRNSFSNYYTKAQSDAKYIFANPSTIQTANINISGSIASGLIFSRGLTSAGDPYVKTYFDNNTAQIRLGVDGEEGFISFTPSYGDLRLRWNDNPIAYLSDITGGGVSSFNSRTGAVTPQSADYDPFYPLLVGTYNNPTWINTLAYSKITGVPGFITTETDPTVPAYAKTLSAFSVIKTSTDALYEPIFSKNTAFNKNFGTTSGTVAEGNDSRIVNALSTSTASSTYQTLSNLSTDLTPSSTKYPNVNAVNNGLAEKQGNLGWLNVKDFGAVGNGIVDDRNSIQAAINKAVSNKGGTIYFPNGKYLIHGSLVNTGASRVGNPNSQLYLPYVTSNVDTGFIAIKIIGQTPPAQIAGVLGSYTLNKGGVIIYSDIDGSGSFASILGMDGAASTSYFNYSDLTVENIEFRVKANIAASGPTMTALNFKNGTNITINNVFCTIDTTSSLSVYPTAETAGIFLPRVSGGQIRIENTAVTGYKYGFVGSEHVMGDKITAVACEYGFVFANAYHPNYIGRFNAAWCRVPISAPVGTIPTNGLPQSSVNISQLDVEFQTGYGNWWDKTYIINDPSSYLVGTIEYQLVRRAVGIDNTGYNVNGALNLGTNELGTNKQNKNFSDNNFLLRGSGQYTSSYWLNNGVKKAASVWDNTGNVFNHTPLNAGASQSFGVGLGGSALILTADSSAIFTGKMVKRAKTFGVVGTPFYEKVIDYSDGTSVFASISGSNQANSNFSGSLKFSVHKSTNPTPLVDVLELKEDLAVVNTPLKVNGTTSGTAGTDSLLVTVGGLIKKISPTYYGTGGGGSSGTVTNVSVVTANGVSGSVANASSTPAITLSLGNITPTSVTTNLIDNSTGYTQSNSLRLTGSSYTTPSDASIRIENGGSNKIGMGNSSGAIEWALPTNSSRKTLTVRDLSGTVALLSDITGGSTPDTTVYRTVANSRSLAQLQSTFNTKQATLVSGTNIKTINGASVLGSGDLTVTASLPSLTNGSVVFSNGTTITQDNSNFFWDDTNNRLGIGTTTPQTPLQVMHTPSSYVGAQLVGNSPSTNLLDDYPALAIINTNTTTNNYAGIDFYDSASPASQWASASVKTIWTTHGTSNATSRADLAFVTNGADGFNTRLRITSAGLLNVPGLTASSMLKTDASKNIAVAVSNTDYLPVASPAMTGTPVAPTPGTNINTTQIPTTAWTNTYYAAKASPALTGTPTSTTATAKTNTTQIATTAFVSKQFTATGSGTGAATTITVAHGITGVTSANSVIVFPNNAAAAGISYATMDATNVSIVYTVAPASGTNNLSYSISIK